MESLESGFDCVNDWSLINLNNEINTPDVFGPNVFPDNGSFNFPVFQELSALLTNTVANLATNSPSYSERFESNYILPTTPSNISFNVSVDVASWSTNTPEHLTLNDNYFPVELVMPTDMAFNLY